MAGILYGHSKQTLQTMAVATKEKEKKTEQDRVAGDAASAKAQLATANALLDKYRARYPDLEEKKVEAVETTTTAAFSYTSLESGEFIEGFATGYDTASQGEVWNSDGANDTIEKAERRS